MTVRKHVNINMPNNIILPADFFSTLCVMVNRLLIPENYYPYKKVSIELTLYFPFI